MRALSVALLLVLTGCASQQRSVQAPAQPVPQMTWQQMAKFPLNCGEREEQLVFLQRQLTSRPFYTIDGVEGNEEPNRISKRYTTLTKMKMWQLRLNCPDSRFNEYKPKAVDVTKHREPTHEVRCYYRDEHTAVKQNDENTVDSKRTEVCTNQPLVTSLPNIKVGDIVMPTDLRPFHPIKGVRKWRGHYYRMALTTEAHNKQAVDFAVVLMEQKPGIWQVIDKF